MPTTHTHTHIEEVYFVENKRKWFSCYLTSAFLFASLIAYQQLLINKNKIFYKTFFPEDELKLKIGENNFLKNDIKEICVCICIYIYIYIYIYKMSIYMCVCVYIYIYMYIYKMSIYMCVCVYIYIYVCVHIYSVCVCICIYMVIY